MKSLNSGVLPSDWTRARITPMFKKGSKVSLGLPGEKMKQICKEALELIQKECVSSWPFSVHRETECCLSGYSGIPLFYRALQGDLQKRLAHGGQDYNHLLTLSPQA